VRLPGTLIAALGVASCLAACAGIGEPGGRSEAPFESQSEGAVITDIGAPRDRARAHTDLAAAYYELGSMGVALEEARIALSSDANYAPAYNVLGLVQMDLKENAQAQANFERALSLAPNDPDANHNYGWFLCQTGREQQAVRYFIAAARNPLYATPQKSYTVAGVCVLRLNDEAQAVDYFERALRLEPNYLSAVLPLAKLRYRHGELESARALVTQFNRQAEGTSESLWLALRVERRLGDKAAESAYADQLRRRFGDSLEYQSLQKGLYE
jgi:type IV pilus assembly protein PilF